MVPNVANSPWGMETEHAKRQQAVLGDKQVPVSNEFVVKIKIIFYDTFILNVFLVANKNK